MASLESNDSSADIQAKVKKIQSKPPLQMLIIRFGVGKPVGYFKVTNEFAPPQLALFDETVEAATAAWLELEEAAVKPIRGLTGPNAKRIDSRCYFGVLPLMPYSESGRRAKAPWRDAPKVGDVLSHVPSDMVG